MDQQVAYFKNNSTYTFNNNLKLDLMNISFRVTSCNYKKISLNRLNLFIKGEFLIKYKRGNNFNRFNNFNSFNKFNKSEIILPVKKLLMINLNSEKISKLEIDFLNIESSIKRISNSDFYRIDLFISFFITSNSNLDSTSNNIKVLKNNNLNKYKSKDNINNSLNMEKNKYINEKNNSLTITNNIDRDNQIAIRDNRDNNSYDQSKFKEIRDNDYTDINKSKTISSNNNHNSNTNISDEKPIEKIDSNDEKSNDEKSNKLIDKNEEINNKKIDSNKEIGSKIIDNKEILPFYFLLDLNLDFSKELIALVKNVNSKIIIEKIANYEEYICLTGKVLISVDYISKENKLNFRLSSQPFSVIDKSNLKSKNLEIEVLETLPILEFPHEELFKRLNILILIKVLNSNYGGS